MRHCFTVLCTLILATTFSSSLAFSQTLKFAEHDTTAGTGPIQLVRTDFNNDTIPDLAVLNQDSGTVTVYLLNGDGTFRSHQDFAVGPNPTGIAAGDFNHDHKMDLVTSNDDATDTPDSLSLLLGNGDGTFQAAKSVFGGSEPVAITVGDFDGDGNLDAATVTNDAITDPTKTSITVWITLGDGKGGFKSQIEETVIEDVQDGARHKQATKIVASDFNHDGKTDLAFSERNGGFDVELGDVVLVTNQGGGQFKDSPAGDVPVPTGLAVSDINQDGFDDILVSFSGCHTPCLGASYLRNNAGASFTYIPVVDLSDSQFGVPYGPSAGDVNGDGLKDMVVAAESLETNHVQLVVALQKADGTFSNPPIFVDTNRTGNNFHSTVTADLTKDGRVDMALSSEDGVSTLVNTTTIRGCPAPSTTRALKICLPSTSSGGSPVQLLASTRDSLPIEAIKVYVDGVSKFTTTDDLLSGRLNLPSGKHQLQVKAWDRLGSFAQTVSYTVANSGCAQPGTNRTVNICVPANGSTVASPVHLQAGIADSGNITSVQLYVDGVLKSSMPATHSIDTSVALGVGSHRITVKAWDSTGQFSQTTTFTVH